MLELSAPGKGEVRVWTLSLDGDAARAVDFLSPDEKSRAERFRFDGHRQRFVCGRAGLRRVLGACTESDPASLEFRYGSHGKPALTAFPQLGFNLSHSGGRAVIAVAIGAKVGVDLEHVRLVPRWETIAQRNFSTAEYDALAELPREIRDLAFFVCWTRKEAFVKAVGGGITGIGLRDFDVTVARGEPPRVAALRGSLAELSSNWSLFDLREQIGGGRLDDGEGAYAGALALSGEPWVVVDGGELD